MFIVKLTGGLGNQMFQYALYLTLSDLDNETFMDDFSFKIRFQHEETTLKSIFPRVQYRKAAPTDSARLGELKMDYFNKIRRNTIGRKKTHIEEKKIDFKKEILQLKGDYYLDGYWQSEKYWQSGKNFSRIPDAIRNDFTFRPVTSPPKLDLIERMQNGNSVSVHVRKAKDYENKSRINTCGVDYYRKAIDKIRNSVTNPVFYIISDNFDWCRKNLTFADAVFVDMKPIPGVEDCLDMQLMSCCKHNIIANSSYSWWGAWLNPNKDKQVIAPATWFNKGTVKYNMEDLAPKTWITL